MAAGVEHDFSTLEIVGFSKGYSVYALAISPAGEYVAVGTRAGLIHVHRLENYRASANSLPLFDMFHQGGVTGIAFCTDEIFVTGGIDGRINVWSLPQKKKLGQINAHTGGVFALCRIGSLLLASFGKDGLVRIWDMDTLEEKFAGEQIELPRVPALTCLDYDPFTGLLICPSRSGELHIYDVKSDFGYRKISAHKGDFCSLACGDKKVATAGLEDSTLKIWSCDFEKPQMQTSLNGGVFSVGWIDSITLMTVGADGGRIWHLDDTLRAGVKISDGYLRVCRGLSCELLTKSRSDTDRRWRDSKIRQARQLIGGSDPQSQRGISQIARQLTEQGFSAEASMILADAAKAQDRVLWELESRLGLVENLGQDKTAVPSLYALADLLAKLKEPEMAFEFFDKARKLEPDYRDLETRIDELQPNPLMNISHEDTLRGDFPQPHQVLQEIEKHKVLSRPFTWPVVLETKKVIPLNADLDIEVVCRAISARIDSLFSGQLRTDLRRMNIFRSGELSPISCVCVYDIANGSPVAYCLEIRVAATGSELIPCAIFDPALLEIPGSASQKEHNELVTTAWTKTTDSSRTRRWLADVNDAALSVVRQLRDKALASQDQGLF